MKLFLVLICLIYLAPVWGQQQNDTIRVYFPFDEAMLTTEAQATLDSFVHRYRGEEVPATLTIRGHCDAKGSHAYNELLSQRRTRTVHDYLLNKGLTKTAVARAEGFGERQPLNDNRTKEERSRTAA